ncbi:hypothetical protein AVE30378_01013 [Achromobacter veterisilvae]|uniref:Lysozyme n=1 Tax=Achromobacter veterisilvae TaxID=2069367 RepID=A0A446C986_9BURK|nr:glycoside hydrolase family 104 protein [Achromobacter veterisilvae]SSW64311.1 hypothetical protein AVE30378_01013 [Achromobacter veterisilvae]
MTIDELGAYAKDQRVRRFLDAIGSAEGTDTHGYNTAFGGGKLESLADHPRLLHDFTQTDGTPNKTSAAGRYQFLGSTWDDIAGKLGLKDFGPESQDIAAVELLRRNGALPAILADDFDTAIQKSGSTWASLPSSPYAQPKRSPGFMAQALDKAASAILPSAQAAPAPAKAPTPWKDVIAKPEFQALTPEQQAKAQQQYFDQVVAPRVPAGKIDAARAQFMGQYGAPAAAAASSSTAEPGALDNLKEGFQQGFGDIFAGEGQNAIHQTLSMVKAIAPESEMAKRLERRAAEADQEAIKREQDYQTATPGSVAAGVGRIAGGAVLPGAAGSRLITAGGQLARSGASALTNNATVQGMAALFGRAAGSSALGAGLAGAQPITEAGDYDALKSKQLATGGAVGAVIPFAGAAVGAGARYAGNVARSLLQPFTEAGQGKIAQSVMREFASDPAVAATNLGRSSSVLPGSAPTTAEAAGDVGLAQLQRALQSSDPTRFGTALAEQQMANNAARVAALQGIAGDDAARAAAVAARSAAVEPLYAAVRGRTLDVDGALEQLLKRPAMQSAVARAQRLSAERGEELFAGQPGAATQQISGNGLHTLKQALDDMLNDRTLGIGANEQAALRATRGQFMNWLESRIPEYGQARSLFADLSKPINAMDVGQRLLDKYTAGTADLAGNPRLMADAFNKALRNERALVRQSTGFGGVDSLADVMNPQQLQTIQSIVQDLSRQAATQNVARAAGSNTMQNIATDRILQALLPGKLGQVAGDKGGRTVLGQVGRLAYSGANERIRERLAEALLDPAVGRAAFQGNGGGVAAQAATQAGIKALFPDLFPAITTGGLGLPAAR